MQRLFLSFVLLTFALPVIAKADDRTELARSIISGHILPGYEALAAQSKNLQRKVDAVCGSDASLSDPALQQAYKKALSAWMRIQHVRFGPAMKNDRFYSFQFWPDKHGQAGKQIRRRLAGPIEKIPNNQQIGRGSVALQGFPALERVLFPRTPIKPEQRAKVCKLASAIGFNLTSMATETAKDWQSYALVDAQAVLGSILRNMMEELQVITSLKLNRPLGSSLETARPRRAESWRSRMSLKNINANLAGLRDLLAGGNRHPGLASVLPNEGETLGMRDAMIEQLTYGISRIEAYQGSLYDAVSKQEGREFATFLISHLDGLRELIFEQLAPALGVNLGFNAQDGD